MSILKRNVHKSGPIGMLMESGEITTVDTNNMKDLLDESTESTNELVNYDNNLYKTKSGIKFSENELITIDTAECEPWKYANRQEKEVGDIAELVESIRTNGQLQPALVRDHPKPHGKVKYEIIFGRRRYIACNNLGISLLAIKKDFNDVQDAIASQDAENRYRNNVSNYSNALLYKKLLIDGVFKEEGQLAKKLGISKSSFSELMSFNKIPQDIIQAIPNIHNLSIDIALKINALLKGGDKETHQILLKVASQIGISVTSPEKLEKAVIGSSLKGEISREENSSYTTVDGIELFLVKERRQGETCLIINKSLKDKINKTEFYDYVKKYLERMAT